MEWDGTDWCCRGSVQLPARFSPFFSQEARPWFLLQQSPNAEQDEHNQTSPYFNQLHPKLSNIFHLIHFNRPMFVVSRCSEFTTRVHPCLSHAVSTWLDTFQQKPSRTGPTIYDFFWCRHYLAELVCFKWTHFSYNLLLRYHLCFPWTWHISSPLTMQKSCSKISK